jgi:acetyl-CoA acetyltransferase
MFGLPRCARQSATASTRSTSEGILMAERVFVIGVGMTKFEKPGSKEWDYPDMGREAGQKALADAGIEYSEVEDAFLAYCYGDSTAGQRALYELGLSGIPAINVNNNCSTGSSALYLGRKFIQGGLADCVLALGFEKMEKGSLGMKYTDRTLPLDKHFNVMNEIRGFAAGPPAAQMFGNAGREYMERYGVKAESFARIGEKNHRHSVNNPYSQFQDEYTLDDILNAPMIHDPLTKLQCCPTSDGGAAAVLASERFVKQHGLEAQAVEIVGQSMTTDFESSFSGSDMSLVGFDMTRAAAQEVYKESGLGPEDVDVVELHDCFSANELITYEGLGLCAEGQAGELIDSGAVTYGGQVVVNPSGGLISKGHPLGATGLAQCSELTWQLRGTADKRQVDGASVALQHNLGLGGAAVVTMYRKDS